MIIAISEIGCSQHGFQSQRLVLDPSNKLPLYRRTGVKAPSPQIQSQEPSTQATLQTTSASGGQYCIYQKPKQVTCNVAHMKRVTHQFKYYCGTQSQQKVCTGHRCVTIIIELDHEQTQKTYAQIIYRKIPKISPGAYIFQRPFLRGLFLEGLIYGGKLAFENRLG